MGVAGPTDDNALDADVAPDGDDVPGIAEPAEPAEPVDHSDAPDAAGAEDEDVRGAEDAAEEPVGEEGARTRPCAYCGRPVPQPEGSAPVARYCLDNGGACARAAAERRRRDQDTPGLAGQVARTWDLVERLEDVAELLAMSLTGDLSVAGVERRIADIRAEAAGEIAAAQKDRESARHETQQLLGRIADALQRAERAEAEAAALRAQMETARTERDTARDIGVQATRTAEAATGAVASVRAERDRLNRRIAELTSALDLAREEIARYRGEMAEAKEFQKRSVGMEETRSRLRSTESELAKMRTTAQIAQNARAAAEQARAEADRQALEARSHAEEMSAARDEAATELEACKRELEEARSGREELVADLEAARRDLDEARSQPTGEDAGMLDQLRAALAKMISERDAARAELDEANARMEQFGRGRAGVARHARAPDPPPGTVPQGHDLGGVTGPATPFRHFPPPEK
jgi:DNA repair exonuclease SbcCD ATPase subunit